MSCLMSVQTSGRLTCVDVVERREPSLRVACVCGSLCHTGAAEYVRGREHEGASCMLIHPQLGCFNLTSTTRLELPLTHRSEQCVISYTHVLSVMCTAHRSDSMEAELVGNWRVMWKMKELWCSVTLWGQHPSVQMASAASGHRTSHIDDSNLLLSLHLIAVSGRKWWQKKEGNTHKRTHSHSYSHSCGKVGMVWKFNLRWECE